MGKTYGKNRGWEATLYPDRMAEDWKQRIDGLVQVPFCYCVHDKDKVFDKDEERKVHVHLMIVFQGPTTHKHALEVFHQLDGSENCLPMGCRPVYSYERCYDYWIHDTEDARKAEKHQYDPSERISGNGFDIGALVQVSTEDKKRMRRDLAKLIIDSNVTNFRDFQILAWDTFVEEIDLLDEVVGSYSAYFERLVKGNYQAKVSDIAFERAVNEKVQLARKVWESENAVHGQNEQSRD